jgi:ubiquinone/menaquinone biosynthesis C-methylase UbiE
MEKIICPFCSANSNSEFPLSESPRQADGLHCPTCKTTYRNNKGIIDFVGDGHRKISLSQRAMEFGPIVAIYERIWRPLITKPFSDLSWEMKTASDLLDLMPHHDLLDIACGTGNFTRLFADTLRNGSIIGADLSLPMLIKAVKELKKSGHANITFMRVDVTKWPFAAQCFDRIHCAGGLHIIPEVQSVFHSLFRSLKPGGIFVGATYIKEKGSKTRSIKDMMSTPSGFHWFDPEELFGLADRAGFIEWEQHIKKQAILFRVRKKIA